MSSAYEIECVSILRKEINRHLRLLGLPEEKKADEESESLFIRLYDIKHFGYATDDNFRKMFLDREHQRNEVAYLRIYD